MPCYTVEESGIKVTANTNPDLLKKALEELGYTVTKLGATLTFANYSKSHRGFFRNGELTITNGSGEAVDQNEIRRAYSAQVVMSAAKRFGWQVKQTSPTQFQVSRRA